MSPLTHLLMDPKLTTLSGVPSPPCRPMPRIFMKFQFGKIMENNATTRDTSAFRWSHMSKTSEFVFTLISFGWGGDNREKNIRWEGDEFMNFIPGMERLKNCLRLLHYLGKSGGGGGNPRKWKS